jgi:hypothetical protein
MQETDITEIERTLDVTLPDNYVRQLLAEPFGDGREDFYECAGEIIRGTLFCRERNLAGGTWRDQWVVIGNVGNGDYWFIDTERETSPVFATSHDGGSPVQQDAASVAEWVAFLRALDAIPEEDLKREHEELMARARRVRDFFALDLRRKS